MSYASFTDQVEILTLGDHICFLYETDEEHRMVLTRFLCQGLKLREKILYIADIHTDETIIHYLTREGLDVEKYLKSGQLKIINAQQFYLPEGIFDPDRMIDVLQMNTELAAEKGFHGLRVTSEMAWSLKRKPGSQRLIEYEAKLNDCFKDSRCLSLCQYDRRYFSPALLLYTLSTHSLAIVGIELHQNTFYMAPPPFFENDHPQTTLNWWLHELESKKKRKGSDGQKWKGPADLLQLW